MKVDLRVCWRVVVSSFLVLIAAALFVGLLSSSANSTEPSAQRKTILLLDSFHPEMPWAHLFHRGFVSGLSDASQQPLVFKEYMDSARFPKQLESEAYAVYLDKKYADKNIDLVITQSGPASVFLQNQLGLFSGVPRLFVDPAPSISEHAEEPIIAVQEDVVEAFDQIVATARPNRVVVVGETQTNLVQQYVTLLRRERPSGHGGVGVDYLLDLPMDNLLQEVERLPSDTVIFYILIFRDGAGQNFIPYVAAQKITQRASVPVFSHWDSLLDSGIAGGYLLSAEHVGLMAARDALTMLSGGTPTTSPDKAKQAFGHMYDWRVLDRYGFDESQLPADREVFHRQPSFWAEYLPYMLGVAVLLLLLWGGAILWIVTLRNRVAERTAALALSEARYEQILGNMNSGVAVYTAIDDGVDFVFADFNAAAERIEQISKAQLLGRKLTEMFPGVEEFGLLAVFQRVWKTGEPEHFTASLYQDDRISGWRENYVYKLPSGEVVAVYNDITERVKMEGMLVQSEKMMSIIGLATGMAHELNNPLGAMMQNTQNISRRLSADLPKNAEVAAGLGIGLGTLNAYIEQRDIPLLLQSVTKAGEQASDIIKGLISLSHKTGSVEKTHASLSRLADKAVVMAEIDYDLKRSCNFTDIEIKRDYAADLPDVLCHESDIESTLLAVLSNAAQAMKGQERKPCISLRTYAHGRMAVIEIEDNGPGMSEADHSRVFEPFFTTASPERKGLGLTFAYSTICEANDGQIRVHSHLGKGTQITIELPFGK